jgi:DNA-binding CsgD family transcriptional regulator/GAF domain-containing protein
MMSLAAIGEEALSAVMNSLAGARLDPESVLRIAVATLSELRPGTWVATLMSKDPRQVMIVAANEANPEIAEYAEAMYPLGEAPTVSFTRAVIETGKPLLVPPGGSVDGIGFMVVPMRTREATIGTLGLFDTRRQELLNEDDVKWLQAIADRVGMAVENGQVRVAAKTRLTRLAAIRTVTMNMAGGSDLRLQLQVILDQAIAGLEINAADVLVQDGGDVMLRIAAAAGFHTTSVPEYLVPLREALPGELIVGQAVTSAFVPEEGSRRTLFAREGFRSRRAAPLISRGKIIGAIEVFSRANLQPDQEWLDFLEVLAQVAAVAIDRAGTLDRLHTAPATFGAVTQIASPAFGRLQTQILGLVVDGMSNAAIADKVHLSPHTIKFHVQRILKQAGVANRTELARKATKEGWL